MAIKPLKTDIEVVGFGSHHFDNIKTINDNFEELAGGNGSGGQASWTDLTDKPAVIAAGATAAEARTAIGAGTSNLTIGTTASTAKAGNYVPAWNDVTGKPATFAPVIGTTATTAMAGNTPLLAIGTTATTAKAGNYVPTWGEVTGKPATFTPTIGTTATTAGSGADMVKVKADIEDLVARVLALETTSGG